MYILNSGLFQYKDVLSVYEFPLKRYDSLTTVWSLFWEWVSNNMSL